MMRLLNTETLRMEEFFDSHVPLYAILSHTWEHEEILFHDMSKVREAKKNYGFEKLQGACKLAKSQGYKWIWIDTCCIDKSSSAELTEAINSMFRYYQDAGICYAYLGDVKYSRDGDLEASVRKSRWFTRGWTLQELLAPAKLEFYSAGWQKIGHKAEPNLAELVSRITGIDMHTLMGGNIMDVCIPRRMHWASTRQTTRVEDRAYSLLGIFKVNMPMIYGEGKKAFRRLQEEILKSSDDQSIFAWHNYEYSEGSAIDALATSPSDFVSSGSLSREPFPRIGRKPTTITSQGIAIELPIMSVTRLDMMEFQPFEEIEAILDCQFGNVPGTFPTIRLRSLRQTTKDGPKHYYRVMSGAQMTTFEYFNRYAFVSDVPVIGLDPTRLHIDAYKETLDNSYLQWKLDYVFFTRSIPQDRTLDNDYRYHIPWSLSLHSNDYPPDNTRYWVLCFAAHSFDPCITSVYPSESWDASSMQMRVPNIPKEYYSTGKFRFIDAVLNVTITYEAEKQDRSSAPAQVIKRAILIIGRQADSRRMRPEPWCRFLADDSHSLKPEVIISSYAIDVAAKAQEQDSSVLRLDFDECVVKATIQPKEISGIFYHVPGLAIQASN